MALFVSQWLRAKLIQIVAAAREIQDQIQEDIGHTDADKLAHKALADQLAGIISDFGKLATKRPVRLRCKGCGSLFWGSQWRPLPGHPAVAISETGCANVKTEGGCKNWQVLEGDWIITRTHGGDVCDVVSDPGLTTQYKVIEG